MNEWRAYVIVVVVVFAVAPLAGLAAPLLAVADAVVGFALDLADALALLLLVEQQRTHACQLPLSRPHLPSHTQERKKETVRQERGIHPTDTRKKRQVDTEVG